MSWQDDLAKRAEKVESVNSLEGKIRTAFNGRLPDEFEDVIEKAKRPVLKNLAHRLYDIVARDNLPDWMLYASALPIAASTMFLMSDADFVPHEIDLLAALVGLVGLGFAIWYFVLIWKSSSRSRKDAENLVSKTMKRVDRDSSS